MYSPIDVYGFCCTVQRGQSVEKRTHVALSLLSGGGILGNGPKPSCCSFCFTMFCYRMLYDTRRREKKKGTFFCVSVRYIFSIYTLSSWPRSRRKFLYGPISFVGIYNFWLYYSPFLSCVCICVWVCLDVIWTTQNTMVNTIQAFPICIFFFFTFIDK